MSRAELIQLMRQCDLIDFRDEDDDEHVAQLVDAVEALVGKAVEIERKACAAGQNVEQAPHLWYDPETGAIWTPEDVSYFQSTYGLVPLYTHSQNLSCKSSQARLATLWGYVKEQPQQEQEWKRRLGNLLAVIHGDGGHYIDAHGWDKAQADAEEKVARVMTGLPQSASVVWPRNAREVRAFLSGHVAAERYARDDHQPDDSDTYTLSAHDLLGAIDWWTDFDQRPHQPLTNQQILHIVQTAQVGDHGKGHTIARAIEAAHGIGGEK